ncbi:CDP-glycerol glycerophosphotransferase family protein [Heyndrickxia sp. NPDC080065]|uniref:CDP-glycerol glycerophosphotransferase family protein n=1 Tax=Heyndrickxia sp. NPDC080065 TaxID=3390568 RepID=UPI003D06203F
MVIKKINSKTLKRRLYFVLSPLKRYLLDKGFRKRAIYTKYMNKKPINEKMIFYEAYHGQSMTGNPYAVFKYLIEHPSFQNYLHVWAIKDKAEIQEDYKKKPNVYFVRYQSIAYVKCLATAKYLINDTTFPYYFHKRKEQIYVNIWHGTPLKTMGIDIKNRGLSDHKNIQRNFLFADYMVNPNQFTAEKLLKSHEVYTIFNGKVLDTGYPRVDLMFHADKEKLRKKLSIPSHKNIILYAPTWRGKLGEEKNESEKLLHDIQQIQKNISDEYVVLLKSHYYAYKFFKEQKMESICVPNRIDTNELLSIVDLLITDYSSIFFEFLPTNKSIIFYTYDAEEYVEERGTYIDLDELPGPICKTVNDVIKSIHHLDDEKRRHQESYDIFLKKYCYHDDGKATSRIVDIVFLGKPTEHQIKVGTDKTKILIYGGGFLNNGITTSFINLLNAIDYNKYDVTVVDYGNNNKEEKLNNIKKINKNVKYLYRVGSWNATLSDWYRHSLMLRRGIYTEFMEKTVPSHMYKRELERMIGGAKFDIGIDFSGYSPFWAIIMAFGDFKKKSIYLHNDMGQEIQKKVNNRYPHRKNLKVIFSLYNYFDKVISVSNLTNEQNRNSLSHIVKDHFHKMDFVINTIDYKKVLSMKNEYQYEFSIENDFSAISSAIERNTFPMPNKSDINFINIGRLGPEKDQEKLINSFSEVVKNNDSVKLYIVGDGVLKEDLFNQVERLKLEDKVIFTGQINNPYFLLNQCDCFVLSSNHEGQPMVLLEALILKKPIIVTDIPGSRSVVGDGYGLIVDNSVNGLISGMNQFIEERKLAMNDFDYEKYSAEAINMFYEKVCSLEAGGEG